MKNPSPVPLACDMSALSPEARRSHTSVTEHLGRLVQGVDELPDGFSLHFKNETNTIVKLGEFVSNERLCCPFLRFELQVGAIDESIRLSLTGPENVKEFLQAEFGGVLQNQ